MDVKSSEIQQRLRQLLGNPLFEAAREDDVGLLQKALDAGRSLADARTENGFTPLHTAALNGSAAFLRDALKHPTANPWMRDHQGYLPIDHADVRRDRAVMQILYDAMYPDGQVPLPADPSS